MRIKTAIKILKRKDFLLIFLKFIYAKLTEKPIALMVEPTDLCNLNCTVCHFRNIQLKRKQHFLDFATFKKLIDQVKWHTVYINFWMAGEPLMNKDIFKMIEYANKHNIVTCISTNAMLLTEEVREKLHKSKLDKMIVSLDGVSPETYEAIRINGKLDTVLENLYFFMENKYAVISLQMIVTKHNEHELKVFEYVAGQLKVDEAYLKSLFINQGVSEEFKKGLQDILPSDKSYLRKKDENCTAKYRSVVLCDGTVVPCCFDAKNEYEFGNIKETPFIKIWNNIRYVRFRKYKNRFTEFDLCKNCGCERSYASKIVR